MLPAKLNAVNEAMVQAARLPVFILFPILAALGYPNPDRPYLNCVSICVGYVYYDADSWESDMSKAISEMQKNLPRRGKT